MEERRGAGAGAREGETWGLAWIGAGHDLGMKKNKLQTRCYQMV